MFPTLLLAFCSQGVASARPSTEAVNAAIDRGVSHLLDSQLLDGSWEFVHEQSLPGQTAMVLYTLLRCGVPSNAPEVELGLAYLRSHRPQDKITYNRSWMLLALLERGDSQDRPLEEELLQGILAAQEPTGLFRYSKTQYSDLSNTQYAALALRAAASARLKISPKIWIRLAEGVGSCQFRGQGGKVSGFAYQPPQSMEDLSTGSMTAAALSTLAIAKQGAGRKLSKKLRKRIDTQIAAGSKWLAEHWRVDGNPGHPSGGPWQYHYLYALERIGSFLGMERIGNHDWYGEGASWLVKHLQEDDRWSDGVGEETATCLALLFLKRASAPVTGVSKGRVHAWGETDSSRPVSLRVTGEYQYTLWIVGFGEQVLRENAWPQDQGKGLRVVKVDYIGYPPHGGPEVLLASVAGNPDRPEASGWHHQHSFRRGGTWRLQARVTVRLPPDSADPEAEPEERVLVSQPLFVPIRANLSAEQLAYASDEARDLLLHHTRFEVQASSQLDDQHQADFVADGSFARVWLCARGDEEPSLSFHFPKGVKAHELVLGHAFTRRRERNWPGPAELEIWLNGDAKVIELRMDPDPRRKTVVPLPKGLVLRRLKILITRQSDGRVGRDPIGFGEIELR